MRKESSAVGWIDNILVTKDMKAERKEKRVKTKENEGKERQSLKDNDNDDRAFE